MGRGRGRGWGEDGGGGAVEGRGPTRGGAAGLSPGAADTEALIDFVGRGRTIKMQRKPRYF